MEADLAKVVKPRRKPGRLKRLLKDLSLEQVTAPAFSEKELDEIENANIFPATRSGS